METELIERKFHFRIDKKHWYSHLIDYSWGSFISSSFGSVALLGTLTGLTSSFTGITITGLKNLLILWSVSFVFGFIISLRTYLKQSPLGLENESIHARRIVIFKRNLWQFKLAHSLLSERIKKLDMRLSDIHENRVFIPLVENKDINEYLSWTETRRKNILRLVKVFKVVAYDGLLNALANTDRNTNAQISIMTEVKRLEEFYNATIEFDIIGHSIIPPEECIRLHDIQIGLTSCIREGMSDLLRSIKNASRVKVIKITRIEIDVTLPKPELLDEYEFEYAKLLLLDAVSE